MLAEFEVQRTIKRTEPWAFTMALAGLIGPSTIHTDTMGIVDGWWREEEGCIVSKLKDAALLLKNVVVVNESAEMNWDLDVKHAKPHRTEKEKTAMTKMLGFVTEANGKAYALAEEGADVDGGHMAAERALATAERLLKEKHSWDAESAARMRKFRSVSWLEKDGERRQ